MFKLKKDKLNKKGLALSKSKGFTLIEMMVSVSIFVIVAFIVVSTLLTMSYAYKKAQKMRLLMDNFNFSLQSMSLDIREGINYDNSTCDAENDCIQFVPIDSWLGNGTLSPICYYLSGTNVKKYIGECSPNLTDGLDIISSGIAVDKLKFYIEEDPNTLEKVKIIISGTAGNNSRELTSFFIQNTVSQRNVDQ